MSTRREPSLPKPQISNGYKSSLYITLNSFSLYFFHLGLLSAFPLHIFLSNLKMVIESEYFYGEVQVSSQTWCAVFEVSESVEVRLARFRSCEIRNFNARKSDLLRIVDLTSDFQTTGEIISLVVIIGSVSQLRGCDYWH